MKKLYYLITVLSTARIISLYGFDIVADGQARAVIIRGRLDAICTMAVNNLHKAVLECTGVSLQILPAREAENVPENMNRIIVGDCRYAAGKGVESKNLQLEEYLIKVSGRDLFLNGHNRIAPETIPRGAPQPGHPVMDFRQYSPAVLWAVNDLLDRHLKVRFLWPGKLGTYYPETVDFRLPDDYELKSRPFFEVRHLWFKGKAYHPESVFDQTNTYMLNHQQGMRTVTWFLHDTFLSWWDLYHQQHPDVIAMAPDGTRKFWAAANYTKLCLSNPETLTLALEQWRRAGRPDMWSLCPNDGYGFCTCQNCRALDAPETRQLPAEDIWMGKVSLTGRYIWFWNQLMSRMLQENPAVRSCVFGYGAYKFCPPDAKLVPGMLVATVPPDFAMDGDGMRVWKGWEATGAKILLRPNWLNTFFFVPYLPLKSVSQFSDYSRQAGMGFEHDTIYGCWAMQGVYYYMLTRQSYRPDLDVEAIKAEYASAFKAAAPEIIRWISYWEKFTDLVQGGVAEEDGSAREGLYTRVCRENPWIRSNALYGTWETLPYIYTAEVFAPAEAILKEAASKVADDPEALARVRFLQAGQQHAIKTIECMNLWRVPPVGRTDAFIKAYVELLIMRRELSPDFVVLGDLLNATENSRRIPILPLDSTGSHYPRLKSIDAVRRFTEQFIEEHTH